MYALHGYDPTLPTLRVWQASDEDAARWLVRLREGDIVAVRFPPVVAGSWYFHWQSTGCLAVRGGPYDSEQAARDAGREAGLTSSPKRSA